MKAILVLAAVLVISGCAGVERVALPRQNFDAVEVGMSRADVTKVMGSPTDEALTFMHWETAPYGDAWVLFDSWGAKAESKYWSDNETLRMADVPVLR